MKDNDLISCNLNIILGEWFSFCTNTIIVGSPLLYLRHYSINSTWLTSQHADLRKWICQDILRIGFHWVYTRLRTCELRCGLHSSWFAGNVFIWSRQNKGLARGFTWLHGGVSTNEQLSCKWYQLQRIILNKHGNLCWVDVGPLS